MLTFVQKTYNILKQTENSFTKINLHIIQCDAEVQEDMEITNNEEFERYIHEIKVKGLGGKDFRPVFTYVDQLIKMKEFENLKGMTRVNVPATLPCHIRRFMSRSNQKFPAFEPGRVYGRQRRTWEIKISV